MTKAGQSSIPTLGKRCPPVTADHLVGDDMLRATFHSRHYFREAAAPEALPVDEEPQEAPEQELDEGKRKAHDRGVRRCSETPAEGLAPAQ